MGKVDRHQKACGDKQYLKKRKKCSSVASVVLNKSSEQKKMMNDFALMFKTNQLSYPEGKG